MNVRLSGALTLLLITGNFGSRPLYVLTVQGNPDHPALVDAAVRTLHLPAR